MQRRDGRIRPLVSEACSGQIAEYWRLPNSGGDTRAERGADVGTQTAMSSCRRDGRIRPLVSEACSGQIAE
ncbi:hypothetical protein J6590_057766 [Homalodisca vitripennis]|nr:hypothetical protein J6590_057766 [Homalodisca vitripennis]